MSVMNPVYGGNELAFAAHLREEIDDDQGIRLEKEWRNLRIWRAMTKCRTLTISIGGWGVDNEIDPAAIAQSLRVEVDPVKIE